MGGGRDPPPTGLAAGPQPLGYSPRGLLASNRSTGAICPERGRREARKGEVTQRLVDGDEKNERRATVVMERKTPTHQPAGWSPLPTRGREKRGRWMKTRR